MDGASLECCRILKSNDQKIQNESFNLLRGLDLNKLINKHIAAHEVEELKNLNEEYLELKIKDELKELNEKIWFSNLCDKISNETVHKDFIISTMSQYYHTTNPFICCMNDTFKLQTSYINSQTYFP